MGNGLPTERFVCGDWLYAVAVALIERNRTSFSSNNTVKWTDVKDYADSVVRQLVVRSQIIGTRRRQHRAKRDRRED